MPYSVQGIWGAEYKFLEGKRQRLSEYAYFLKYLFHQPSQSVNKKTFIVCLV